MLRWSCSCVGELEPRRRCVVALGRHALAYRVRCLHGVADAVPNLKSVYRITPGTSRRQPRAGRKQPLLHRLVAHRRQRLAQLLVVKYSPLTCAAASSLTASQHWVAAPAARSSGATFAAHLGGHPTRLERVRAHRRPAPRRRKSDERIVQLGIGVRLAAAPGPVTPFQIVQRGIAAAMQPRAQVHQAAAASRSVR